MVIDMKSDFWSTRFNSELQAATEQTLKHMSAGTGVSLALNSRPAAMKKFRPTRDEDC